MIGTAPENFANPESVQVGELNANKMATEPTQAKVQQMLDQVLQG
jgi:hypothetical protein